MKENRLLLLLLLIFTSCSEEYSNISIDNWNNQIINKLNKTDSLILKQKELKTNIDFLLVFRKDIVIEIVKLKSKEKFSNFIVYENYNCEFYPKDTVHTDTPFITNKFNYDVLIVSDKENYLYELKGFSEDKNLKFIKRTIENSELGLELLNPENIAKKKLTYLLNDFSVSSKITCNVNNLDLEVISTRLN